MNGDATIKIS